MDKSTYDDDKKESEGKLSTQSSAETEPDAQIDPAEVLPGRVRNLPGPRTSADLMFASGEASLDSSLVMFWMFFTTFPLVLHPDVSKATGSSLVATKKIKKKPMLNYSELGTLLAKAANIVNDRHIGVKSLTEDKLVPITVNQLLLCRTPSSPPPDHEMLGENY